jgi:hypothetical protein
MAPARSSTRRSQIDPAVVSVSESDNSGNVNEELFLDPMLGTPLAMYIEKDVDDKDVLAGLITVSRVVQLQLSAPDRKVHIDV